MVACPMDRATLVDTLAAAERQLAEAEHQVANQRSMAQLEREGRDAAQPSSCFSSSRTCWTCTSQIATGCEGIPNLSNQLASAEFFGWWHYGTRLRAINDGCGLAQWLSRRTAFRRHHSRKSRIGKLPFCVCGLRFATWFLLRLAADCCERTEARVATRETAEEGWSTAEPVGSCTRVSEMWLSLQPSS
jgi:hypothetical protein